MSANIAKTILPGEHGFHTRDGSLTKRKLEQWEKEKAESVQWFPFGTPQARTSRRSREPERSRSQTDSPSAVVKVSANTSSDAENVSSQIAQAQDVINGNKASLVAQNQSAHFPPPPISFHASCASVGHIFSQPTSIPYQVPLNDDNRNSYAAPFAYNHPSNSYIQHFPGLVPIFPSLYPHVPTATVTDNVHNGNRDVNTVSSQHQPLLISTADQWYYSNQQKQCHMMQNATGSFYMPSTCSNDEDLGENRQYSNGTNDSVNKVSRIPPPPLPQDRHELVRMKKAELDEQLMEKRRLEEAILEEERRETERLKKIHEEQERRQEQESAGEVNKWKKRQEALDANEKAFMEKLEKAKFESEVLRKAKRFKHILLHSETTHEKIGEVLGTNDRELIRRVLNELGALERQKRLEMENLNASHVTCASGGGATGSLNSTVSSRPTSTSGVTPSPSQRDVGSSGGLSAAFSASQEPKRSILKNSYGEGSKNVASATGEHTENTPLTRGAPTRSSFRPTGSRKHIEVTEALKRRSGSAERLNNTNAKNSAYASNFSPSQQRRDRIESSRPSPSYTSPASAHRQSPSSGKENPKNTNNSPFDKSDQSTKVPSSSAQKPQIPARPVPPPRRCLTRHNQSQSLNTTASSSSVNSSHTVVIDDDRESPQHSQTSGKWLPTATLDFSSNSRSFDPMNRNVNNIGGKPAIPPKPANIHYNNNEGRVKGGTTVMEDRKNRVMSKKEDCHLNSEESDQQSNSHREPSVLCVNTGVQCDAASSLFSIEQHLRHLNRAFTAVANTPSVMMTRRLVGPNVLSAKRYLNELPATLDSKEGSSKASSSLSSGKQIGLFEPVITRQRMNCQAARHHSQMADFQKGSSVGASSTISASTSSESATEASTSSVSSSPVLSADCKSSSPVFANGNHMADEGGCSSASSNHSAEVSQIYREIGTSESGLQQMSGKFKALLTTPSGSREDLSGGYSNGRRAINCGAGRVERLPPSPFSQKLAETTGNFWRPFPDHSADILRRSLRSPTMMRLQESLSSVNVASNGLNNGKTSGDKDENSRDEYDDPSGSMTSSRCGTPKPFNCRTAQYRSFNLKKDGATTAAGGTERQRRILDQLANVRAQLKNRQENIKRTISNHNIAGTTSVTTGCGAAAPTLSNGGQPQ